MSQKPIIIAHRGLHESVSENSLASIRAAENAGIAAAEFDVRQTRNFRFVLNHNPAFPGTDRLISRYTLAELQTHVPDLTTLDDVLAKTRMLRLCIEVTDEYIDAAVLNKLLQETNSKQRATILSFYPNIVQEPELQDFSRWLLVDIPGGKHFDPEVFRDPVVFSIGLNVQGIAPHHTLVNQAFIKKAKEHNLLVIPWVVNDKHRARELLALGVDGLMTDIPVQLRKVL